MALSRRQGVQQHPLPAGIIQEPFFYQKETDKFATKHNAPLKQQSWRFKAS